MRTETSRLIHGTRGHGAHREPPVREEGNARWALHPLGVRDAWTLAAIVLAFVTSRLVWLGLNPSSSWYWEEAYRWVAAVEILRGPVEPLLDYQADHYQGGSLVMILIAVSLLRIFGENFVVMKLGAVLMSATTLCLLYVLGGRLWGRAVGVIAALAYLAGPPLVAYWGLVVMGSHGESILFSLLQLLLFFEILSGQWRTTWSWAFFGFVSGLGLWFCYTSGLSLAACGISWILLKRMPQVRELFGALAGALLGLVPWFAYNVTREFVGLGRIVQVFGYGDPIDPWFPHSRFAKLVSLFYQDLPFGLLLPFPISQRPLWFAVTLIAAFGIPLAVALALASRRAIRALPLLRAAKGHRTIQGEAMGSPIDIVFLVYGLVFLAFFLGSTFTITPSDGPVAYRLLLQPAVLLMIPAARTVSESLCSGSTARRVAIAGCGLYLVASVAGIILLVGQTGVWIRDDPRGYGQEVRGLLLHRKFEQDLGHAFATARRVDDPQSRFRVLMGIGWGLKFRFEKDEDLDRIRRELDSIPVKEQFAVLAGIRQYAAERVTWTRWLVASNEATSHDLLLVERVTRLARFVDEEWRRMKAAESDSSQH